MVGDVTR